MPIFFHPKAKIALQCTPFHSQKNCKVCLKLCHVAKIRMTLGKNGVTASFLTGHYAFILSHNRHAADVHFKLKGVQLQMLCCEFFSRPIIFARQWGTTITQHASMYFKESGMSMNVYNCISEEFFGYKSPQFIQHITTQCSNRANSVQHNIRT